MLAAPPSPLESDKPTGGFSHLYVAVLVVELLFCLLLLLFSGAFRA